MVNIDPPSSNPFQILGNEGEEGISQIKEKEESKLITIGSIEINQIEMMEEDEAEDMDLGELYLDATEKDCEKRWMGM